MPYQLQSPLASAAGALGGYLEGAQSKQDKAAQLKRQAMLDAQAQADTQARIGIQREGQEATNAYRSSMLGNERTRLDLERDNAATAAARAAAEAKKDADAAAKQKLIDMFQGNGLHYPKNWDTMKPEAKIGYLQVRLNAAQKAGDQKTVSNTETEINRVATEAEQARRDAALAKQRGVQNANTAQRIQIQLDRPTGSDKPLTRYQQIQIDHWNKEHLNPDGSLKSTTKDTSGLSSMGNLQYQKDVRDWMMGGQDPANEPDPTSAKYPKKAAGGVSGGSPPAAKPVMHNGKPYYLHSDGNYYLTP